MLSSGGPTTIQRLTLTWRSILLLWCVVALAFQATPVAAQDADVPVALQIPLFLKVVSFDRQLAARMGKELVVGVAYQGRNRASVRAKEEAVRALRAAQGIGLPRLRVELIDLDQQTLVRELVAREVLVLYVAPLRAIDVVLVADAARAARVTTFTGTPAYLSDGLSVSVRYQGERPKLLINVDASKSEGAEFSAELLKLAQVM